MKWHHQGIHHSTKDYCLLIEEDLYGSRPGCMAHVPVFIKLLENEIYQTSMKTGINKDLDVMLCYDHILQALANTTSQHISMNCLFCIINACTLQQVQQIKLQTSLGIVNKSYQHCTALHIPCMILDRFLGTLLRYGVSFVQPSLMPWNPKLMGPVSILLMCSCLSNYAWLTLVTTATNVSTANQFQDYPQLLVAEFLFCLWKLMPSYGMISFLHLAENSTWLNLLTMQLKPHIWSMVFRFSLTHPPMNAFVIEINNYDCLYRTEYSCNIDLT